MLVVNISAPNPCGEENGNCSHLCLLAPGGKNFTCACPASFKLNTDNRTCRANCSMAEIRCGKVDDRYITLIYYYLQHQCI